jgi:hypothetical protein
VLRKQVDPIWRPPDWYYVETAVTRGLQVEQLDAGKPVSLRDGRQLVVRDSVAGLILSDGEFAALPTDEHIVFDGTLYIPPYFTKNRQVAGELGYYALDLGDGYLLHGTPDAESIGDAVTHGCMRLHDADIEWLYDHIPVGTPVYIY